MLALWLASGVLGSSSAPVVVLRGDDGGSDWRKPFYARQHEEAEQELEALRRAIRRSRKPTKRLNAVQAAKEHLPAVQAISGEYADRLAAALDRMLVANANAASIANAMLAYVDELERLEQAKFRRKREEEAIIALLVA